MAPKINLSSKEMLAMLGSSISQKLHGKPQYLEQWFMSSGPNTQPIEIFHGYDPSNKQFAFISIADVVLRANAVDHTVDVLFGRSLGNYAENFRKGHEYQTVEQKLISSAIQNRTKFPSTDIKPVDNLNYLLITREHLPYAERLDRIKNFVSGNYIPIPIIEVAVLNGQVVQPGELDKLLVLLFVHHAASKSCGIHNLVAVTYGHKHEVTVARLMTEAYNAPINK